MTQSIKLTKPSCQGHRNRLRKKFCETGLDSFLDHEVLEMLLTYSILRKDTKPLAWNTLKRFGSLSKVLDAKPEELENIEGLGNETAVFISFVRALLRRYFLDELKACDIIKCPEDAVKYCKASLEGEKDEIFEVIYLNTRNAVLGAERISSGTIDRTAVPARKVVENALKARAAALIFVHNHPSGIPTPSEEDIALTNELAKAAKVLGIRVHDHVIVGRGNYYSFRANGLLNPPEP